MNAFQAEHVLIEKIDGNIGKAVRGHGKEANSTVEWLDMETIFPGTKDISRNK